MFTQIVVKSQLRSRFDVLWGLQDKNLQVITGKVDYAELDSWLAVMVIVETRNSFHRDDDFVGPTNGQNIVICFAVVQ